MYIRQDGQRLKTKIIATLGSEGRTLHDAQGTECNAVQYNTMFRWFVQQGANGNCFMIDTFRLNMAFYSSGRNRDPYAKVFGWLKQNKNGLARNVGVLCDLAGAKTRLGEIQRGEVEIRGDFQLLLKENRTGNQRSASVLAYGEPLNRLPQYHEILGKLRDRLDSKDPVLISVGDGKTVLEVDSEKNDILHCKVRKEGIIKSTWGITFEGIDLGLTSFGRPDQEALEYILHLDNQQGFVSHIGVSFVRNAQDIINVRQFIENYFIRKFRKSKVDARLLCPDIIAKIETQEGADSITGILDVADGAMIARGDLALQLGREMVPEKQKDIINLCNRRGKVVITATEMLASMEDNPKPTRAEVNDVFNAIIDGTDAVMLSGETSSGKYPSQAVEYMAKIAEKAEKYYERIYARGSFSNTQRIQELRRASEDLVPETDGRFEDEKAEHARRQNQWAKELYEEKLMRSKDQSTTDRICAAACELAEQKEFEAIIASTAAGRTVRMLSRFRPNVRLIGVIYDENCRRKLLLSYGAYSVSIGQPSTGTGWQNPEEVFKRAVRACVKEKLIDKGQRVVFVSGIPMGKSNQGKVNIMQIKEIL